MGKVLRAVIPAVLLLGLIQQGGCSLFHDDYPDDRCDRDSDCFEAQGEVCNLDTNRCEAGGVDAGS